MSIAIVIESNSDARKLVGWGVRFAQCSESPLLVIHASTTSDSHDLKEVELFDSEEPPTGIAASVLESWQSAVSDKGGSLKEETAHEPIGAGTAKNTDTDTATHNGEVSFFRIRDPKSAMAVMGRLSGWGVELLLISSEASAEMLTLFQMAHCPTMLLRVHSPPSSDGSSLLVPTSGHHHDHEALRLAAEFARCEDRQVNALYVERDVGDISQLVGQRTAKRFVSLALLDSSLPVKPATVVSNKVERGVKEAIETLHSGMILMGARGSRIGAPLYGPLTARILKSDENLPVGILRPALPLHHRFLHRIERWLEDQLPQLTRDERVRLVSRIQQGSEFNIDFIALICLSTLIAALGLARNQGAVIIGAMLVAPLMTPLMGFGLALMQGNLSLAKISAKSVLGGFTLALAVGVLVGLLVINLEPASEMLGRGSPGVLDLLVAFVSGMAAAYAVGRPGLAAALPGVAIAAALVPPIATAGMSIALGHWVLAGGAVLLFLTNIVAIALGAAVGLWAVGIRSQHQHGGYESWSAWVITAMVLIVIGLAVYESQPALSFAALPHTLEQDLQRIVDGHAAAARVDLKGSTLEADHGQVRAHLRIESTSLPTNALAIALRNELAKQFQRPLTLKLKTELTTTVVAPEQ